MRNIVVGAGISGATVARVLAERDEQVLVVDCKPHIGGNCYDYRDANGICVHKYSTHIFHMDVEKAWRFPAIAKTVVYRKASSSQSITGGYNSELSGYSTSVNFPLSRNGRRKLAHALHRGK